MFALRGLAVSFAVFAIVYGTLSVAVALAWRRAHHWLQHHRVDRLADGLFLLRMIPLAAAAVITAAFTVPSFLLLEPRNVNEPLEAAPLALGFLGAALVLFGLINAAIATFRASRTVSNWTKSAEPMAPVENRPVLRIPRAVPAMTATGIVRPRILVSASAEFVLTPKEMQTALHHELAHVRRRDNLKKLLLRFVSFPGMAGLESAWLEATEMAADDAAVSTSSEALDLAAALIKLSRFAPAEKSENLTAALVHSPGAVMNARIERLISWEEEHQTAPPAVSVRYGLAAALLTLSMFAVTYSHLLSDVHTATEWLMR